MIGTFTSSPSKNTPRLIDKAQTNKQKTPPLKEVGKVQVGFPGHSNYTVIRYLENIVQGLSFWY